MKPSLSVIILTYNEELNLKKCLKSVEGLVSEIIIVDSGSTDGTEAIAKEFKAKFFVHEFKNQAEQFNWALEHTNPAGDWIMRLDADEELLPELKKEIEEKLPNFQTEINGVVLRRRTYFLGKWMKHGGIYPTELLRIFRRGMGASEEREMDEHLVLKEGKETVLMNDFIDDSRKSFKEWIVKHQGYAKREAIAHLREKFFFRETDALDKESRGDRSRKNDFYYSLPPFFRAFAYFAYRYFIRLGFLDGLTGLKFHCLQGFWYRYLVDLNICKAKKR